MLEIVIIVEYINDEDSNNTYINKIMMNTMIISIIIKTMIISIKSSDNKDAEYANKATIYSPKES